MKKLLLILSFFFFFYCFVKAQNENIFIQDILHKIENNYSYKLIGCIIEEEKINDSTFLVKKSVVEFNDIIISFVSLTFLQDKNIFYQDIVVYTKKTDTTNIINRVRNEKINSFLQHIPAKQFLDYKGDPIVCGVLD